MSLLRDMKCVIKRLSACRFLSARSRCYYVTNISSVNNVNISRVNSLGRFRNVSNISSMGSDSQRKPQAVSVESAQEDTQQAMVRLVLSDGRCLLYPWVWLRDNCQCHDCYNPRLHSRTIHWRHFDVHVRPTAITNSPSEVTIRWSDNHLSDFQLEWLLERSFESDTRQHWLSTMYRPEKQAWDAATFPRVLKRFSFHDVISSDRHLHAWLHSLAVHGVAILTDTPLKKDQLGRLASRVCFIKRTHYGEEFEVRHKPDTTNLAYLSTPLQMHSDLPYYEYKPGVILLHCLVQTVHEGGENELTDVLNVSNKLKKFHPDVYRTLTTTPVDWCDIGEDEGVRFYSLYRSPALCEDQRGQFCRVNYSQQQRDSHFSVPLSDVIPWYHAHGVFTQELYHPDNMVTLKTKPGDILTFDNLRMLHGRTGYQDTDTNERHLIGAYLDWDIVYARMRELATQPSP